MEDLQGFKDALLRQYTERYRVRKRQIDEEIAETVMARRIEVERTVHELRVAHKKKLELGLLANRRRAELKNASFREELQAVAAAEVERRLCIEIEALRSSPRYCAVMRGLLSEASALLRGPAVALVEGGDGGYLKAGGHIQEIREELQGVWGGVILVEQRGRRIDNTLRARWTLLRGGLMSEIQERLSCEEALKF